MPLLSYIGNSYEPTDYVDLYFSVDDIKMEYAVIGHALGTDGWQKKQKRIKEALIKDAKENGADAVHRYGEGSNMATLATVGLACRQ